MEKPSQEDLNKTLKELINLMVNDISSRERLKKLINTHEEIDNAWLKHELNQIG